MMNFIKILINLILYIIYSVVSLFFGGLFYGYYLKAVAGEAVPSWGAEVYTKVGVFILVIVLILTFLLRRFLYISLKTKHDEEDEDSLKVVYNEKEIEEKKVIAQEVKQKDAMKQQEVEKKEDDDMEIYVTKEIK